MKAASSVSEPSLDPFLPIRSSGEESPFRSISMYPRLSELPYDASSMMPVDIYLYSLLSSYPSCTKLYISLRTGAYAFTILSVSSDELSVSSFFSVVSSSVSFSVVASVVVSVSSSVVASSVTTSVVFL